MLSFRSPMLSHVGYGGGGYVCLGPDPGTTWSIVDSWSYSSAVTEVVFTDLCQCDEIMLVFKDVTTSASAALTLELSVDNGASWFTSGGYQGFDTQGFSNSTDAASTSSAITTARSGFMALIGAQLDTDIGTGRQNRLISNNPATNLFVGAGDRVDAARIRVASGNITGGSAYLMGRR